MIRSKDGWNYSVGISIDENIAVIRRELGDGMSKPVSYGPVKDCATMLVDMGVPRKTAIRYVENALCRTNLSRR